MFWSNFVLIFGIIVGYVYSVDIDKTWLEKILKNEDKSHTIDKILTVTLSPREENVTVYGSEDTRITMDVQLHDGSKIKKSLILKTLPSTPALRKQIEESGIFKTEILVYKNALSKMENILNNLNDKSESLWVRALDVREFDQILLEDVVGDLGYITADRQQGWNLDQSILAMKGLAKFHALAAVANEEHRFNEWLAERNYDKFKEFYDGIFKDFAKVIDEKWGPEWTAAANKVQEVAPHVTDKLNKLYGQNDIALKTLNLGAPSISNIFFKNSISDSNHSEKPVAVRLSYFQVANYGSPIHDVQYILNTSPNLEVMTHNRDNLLSEYYTSLVHHLKKFGYKGKEPSHDDFINEVKRTNFEGITKAIQILHLRFEHKKSKEELEKDAEESANTNSTMRRRSGMYSKEYETIMKVLLKKAIDEHVL